MKIDMLGIITNKFDEMTAFYRDVLGFEIAMQMDNYVEFKNEGVRFALSTNKVMKEATGDASYDQDKQGQSLELAFRVDTPDQVDSAYKALIEKGARPIKEPEDQPWQQRTAFFADPDYNIHEIFADVSK